MALLTKNNCMKIFYRLTRLQLIRAILDLNRLQTLILRFLVFVILACAANFSVARNKSDPLLDLSIEELMNIKVTTVSRRPQKLTEVASAVFVITQDDIRRSGATNIPEALRMAPGIEVERIGTDKWAISIRGFDSRLANKLQVLMDGRSVYLPSTSGVVWSQQDTLIEDIERIEVIRGPNAGVWGANAVNGIINIITKRAADTQGTLLTAGGGSFEQGFVGARYGGKINEETPFRVYAKGFTRDNTESLTGKNNHDQWHSARGGFRIDHSRGIDQFTLQSDIFSNFIGDTLNKSTLDLPAGSPRGQEEGGNIRFRWDRTLSDRSSIMLQTYYDYVHRFVSTTAKQELQSFDIDFQHRFPLFDRHDITWGSNYRLYHNNLLPTATSVYTPQIQTNQVFSGFLRDEIKLIPDRLFLTLGTRLDRNDFTGLEIQPNARLMWTPNTENSIWMAVSRAVRTPARAENDVQVKVMQLKNQPGLTDLPFPVIAMLVGNHNFKSEKLMAYELGYRHQFSPQASVDIAGFINDYSNLRDFSFGALSLSTGLPNQYLLPMIGNNQASAVTYGVEVSADWKPLNNWRLQSNYSFLDMHISSSQLSKRVDPNTGAADKLNPQHQFSLRSNYDISEKLELNLWLRYTSEISYYKIPGYVTMDTRLTFRPAKNIELFVVGQNLFSQHHREYVSDIVPSAAAFISRGIYAGAQWRF